MTPQELKLTLKRQRLQLQSAAQRAELQQRAAVLVPTFQVVDALRAGVRYLKERPHLIVIAVVVVVVTRPRRVFRWLKRGLIAWGIYRRWRGHVPLLPGAR
jgi:hypothetical protein